ncbi:proteasome inhibitor 31 kDa [Haemaphysalis longicornis]
MSSTGGARGPSGYEKYFALELTFKSCAEALKSKADALVLLVHYLLVRSGKRCVGTTEEWKDSEQSTELLPSDWNANQTVYTIRYISPQSGARYLLKVLPADGFLLINVVHVQKEKTASTNLNIGKFVTDEFADFRRAYTNLDSAVAKVTREVVAALESMESGADAAASVREASSTTSQDNNPLHVPSRQPGMEWYPTGQEPGRLGQRDLDPFYQGGPGGGMIMDPRQIPRPHHSDPGVGIPGLPRGAVPPGARFDPFGPPRPDDPSGIRYSGPNPDHLPRPPDYDDMFS